MDCGFGELFITSQNYVVKMRVDRKQIILRRYLIALVFAAGIFITGLFLGLKISEMKMEAIAESQKAISLDILDFETYNFLAEESFCSTDERYISHELNELGKKLSYLESEFGYDSDEVKSIKKRYFLLEIRHWVLKEKEKEFCNRSNIHTILYFYRNVPRCGDCIKQGKLLTYFKAKYPNLYIYSFDVNYDLISLKHLLKRFGVDSVPFLVVDSKPIKGFVSKEELEKLLEKS